MRNPGAQTCPFPHRWKLGIAVKTGFHECIVHRADKDTPPTPLKTAARYEDVLAHVTLAGTGGKGSRLVPLWDQTRVWDPGD